MANATSDTESQYFDSIISNTGEFNPFLHQGWDTLRERFEEMVIPSPHIHLLGVGCGTGQSRQIYDRIIAPTNYTGIDLSTKAIELAKSKFPDSHW